MKRIICKSKFKFKEEEFEVKSLQDKEVLVRIHGCGICASDIHDLERGLKSWQPLGHEMVGVVEKTGRDVDNVPAGTPVAIRNATVCGECEFCLEGKPRFCRNVTHCIGGFATHVAVNNKALLPLGKVTLSDGVLAEPLNVAFDLVNTAEVKPQEPVIIVGPGTIGVLAAYLIDRLYKSPIWAIGRNMSGEQLKLLGNISRLEGLYDVNKMNWREEARGDLSRLKNAKFLFTTPPSAIAKIAQSIAPYGSIFTTIGLAASPKEELISIPLRAWLFKRYQLRTSFAYPNLYFEEARDLLEQGSIPAGKIISHRFGFDELKKAFNCVRRKERGLIKAAVYSEQELRARETAR